MVIYIFHRFFSSFSKYNNIHFHGIFVLFEDTQIINGTAQEINVKSLKFGEIYKAKLVDSTEDKNSAYFEFKACE